MKKFLVFILALVYLTSSTGATIHMHYCMGKPAGRGFSIDKPAICGKCGMKQSEKDNGCCRDEYKFLKNDADQKKAESIFNQAQLVVVNTPIAFVEITSLVFNPVLKQYPVNHSPPPKTGVALYILNSIFRI